MLVLVIVIALAGTIVAGVRIKEALQPAEPKGLHNVRTGEEVADAVEAQGREVLFLYIIYFNPECGACNKFMPDVIMTYAEMAWTLEETRFGIALVDTGEHTDKELRAFIEQHGIPEGIVVLGGADAEHTGLPADLNVKQGAEMNPSAVPATLLLYVSLEGNWWTYGALQGAVPADYLLSYSVAYFEWLEIEGGIK